MRNVKKKWKKYEDLRSLILKGPKYRELRSLNWRRNVIHIMNYVEDDDNKQPYLNVFYIDYIKICSLMIPSKFIVILVIIFPLYDSV